MLNGRSPHAPGKYTSRRTRFVWSRRSTIPSKFPPMAWRPGLPWVRPVCGNLQRWGTGKDL
eukprot:12346880-Alexandrium_andersonii.AAC.1